jgi:hypothetical protein
LRSTASIAAILTTLAVSPSAQAHHSRAHFATEVTEMTGELVEIKWRNPHVYFVLVTTAEDGSEQVWEMEAASLYTFTRSGVSRDVFPLGEQVLVAGNVSTTRPGEFLATNMLLPDGQEIVTIPTGTERWNEASRGGRQAWTGDEDLAERNVDASQGLFRVWSVPRFREVQSDLPFTDAAIAARADWDVDNNFVQRCERPGMPAILSNGQPHPFELIDHRDWIEFIGEEFDIHRRIEMTRESVPADTPFTPLGFSIGRWEDETTLVVETTRIDWPYFDRIGTPQSRDVTTIERFSLGPDGKQLSYVIAITDPATFTGPATVQRRYLDLGESIERYDCGR